MKHLNKFIVLIILLGVVISMTGQPCPPNVTLAFQQTAVSCFGGNNGSATVSVLGGSGNYTYTWTPSVSTSQTANNLTAGTYSVTVTDNGSGGGGQAVYTEDFDGVQTWSINVSSGVNDTDYNLWVIGDGEGGVLPPNCGVGGNGNNTLHVSSQLSPTAGATYNAGGLCAIGICVATNMRAESPNISTVGYSNLSLNFDYIGNGQALTDNASVLYSINGGTNWITLNPSLKSTLCPSGQGQWTAASFILPATCENIPNLKIAFNWTNNDDGIGSDPSFAVNDVEIVSASGGGGTCFVAGSVTIGQPLAALSATAQVTPPNCGATTGSATINANGGTTPYAYSWSTGQNTATVTNLAPGNHTCTITDAKGCTTTTNVSMPGSQQLSLSTSSTNATCAGANNASVSVTVQNGTAPYTYSWNNGQSTPSIGNLAPGNYTCQVTDATGCTATTSVTVTAPPVLTLTTTGTNVNCFGGQTGIANAVASGGATPYFYSWSNGLAGATIQNLAAGSYTCVVLDANGCTINQSVTITQPAAMLSGTASSTPTTQGGTTGTATVTPAGGTSPYSYSWNTTPSQSSMTATGLAVGVYICQITDANGCKVSISIGVESATNISPESVGVMAWKCYPNPVNDKLILFVDFMQNENPIISLFDITGKEVLMLAEKNILSMEKILEVSSLKQGVYMLKVTTSKGYFTEKIIIE